MVVVQGGRRERNRQFIERLAARVLPETNLFTSLFYKGDLAALGPKALLLLPPKDLEDLQQALNRYRPVIQEFTQATNLNSFFSLVSKQFRAAPSTGPAATQSLLQCLPFMQTLILQARQSLSRPGIPPSPGVQALLADAQRAGQSIYLALNEGRVYLLTGQPRSEALTPRAIEELRRLIRDTQFEVPGVNVGTHGRSGAGV